MKPVLARQMEIYAGYLENTDYHVGLLFDALEDLGIMEETLIYVIIGDNGASAEGSLQGTFNEMITLGGFGALETPEFMPRGSTTLAGRKPITTMRWAGRTRWIRLISGQSRWRRIGAARATARSCIGRTASRQKARFARSSIM